MPSALMTPAVRRIASFGLTDIGDAFRVAPDTWPGVLSRLDFHRLTGIAIAAREAGQLVLEAQQVDELLDHHRSAMLLALAIEQQLLDLAESFSVAGIRAVVLKGPAVAHTIYPDPSMRPFGDLDLLVSTKDWRSACELLREHGYARNLPEPRRGFDERFGKAATHVDRTGLPVDLHRTLVLGPFGLWLDPEELLEHTDTFVLGGRSIERLDATGVFLNAALHAALGTSPPLLLPLRDVVHAASGPSVDWELLADWTTRWRLAAPLRHAFTLASDVLGVDPPSVSTRALPAAPGRSEARALRAYIERRSPSRVAFATLRAIPGLRAKAVYVSGLLVPSRAFLRARAGGSPASYVSRWGTSVRRIVRRHRRTKGWDGHARIVHDR